MYVRTSCQDQSRVVNRLNWDLIDYVWHDQEEGANASSRRFLTLSTQILTPNHQPQPQITTRITCRPAFSFSHPSPTVTPQITGQTEGHQITRIPLGVALVVARAPGNDRTGRHLLISWPYVWVWMEHLGDDLPYQRRRLLMSLSNPPEEYAPMREFSLEHAPPPNPPSHTFCITYPHPPAQKPISVKLWLLSFLRFCC
jgi:hypothetical protein